jgi:hypothetical protein
MPDLVLIRVVPILITILNPFPMTPVLDPSSLVRDPDPPDPLLLHAPRLPRSRPGSHPAPVVAVASTSPELEPCLPRPCVTVSSLDCSVVELELRLIVDRHVVNVALGSHGFFFLLLVGL